MILLSEIINSKYKIFCDMDSVLCDFDGMFRKISGGITKDGWEFQSKYGEDEFWKTINDYGLNFWSKMLWMKDGIKLWNYLKSNYSNINILSAPSTHDNGQSKKGKIMWCSKNLGHVNIILEKNKYLYAGENCVLIDDLEKNISPWINSGGIGILHKSANETISKLKKLK